jgi:hypothetical protein
VTVTRDPAAVRDHKAKGGAVEVEIGPDQWMPCLCFKATWPRSMTDTLTQRHRLLPIGEAS